MFLGQPSVLPKSLDEVESALGRKLLPDPFTGKSLIYRQTPDGYKVYSVGDDKKDDGGQLLKHAYETDEWGVYIRVPRK